jgi:hypothetical protein
MDRATQFSYEGLEILFNGLEALELELDNEMDLDVIGLCCEFVEMKELEIRDAYSLDDSESSTEYLRDRTLVLGATDTSVVFAQF